MRRPSILSGSSLISNAELASWHATAFGTVPERPVFQSNFFTRFVAAWLVFTGRADAVWWWGA